MTHKDIYDIIIENATREWNDSMNNKINTQQWATPQYSKSQINKAGKIIANQSSSKEDYENAITILNNWRAAHAYPLQVICSNLRSRNQNAVVVQRLKRLDSIIGKIKQFPDMNLYRMQDLGGCRVIVDNVEQVYKAIKKYKSSRIRHILKREYDYIQNPKQSGYRSYHMVYQFHSDKKETYNKNMLIEIQFRTKLQHIWATAIETMGIYTKTSLKSSIGDKNILRFFKLVSSVFAIKEDMPICPDTPDNYNDLTHEIKKIDSRFHIVSRLSALSVAIKNIDEKHKNVNGYFLLQLNLDKKTLKINRFKTGQIKLATDIYDKIETLGNPNMDAVLVSATSFDTLRAAYPNYFTDISEFVTIMRKMLEK